MTNKTENIDEDEVLNDFEEGKFKTVDNLSEELHIAQQAAHSFIMCKDIDSSNKNQE